MTFTRSLNFKINGQIEKGDVIIKEPIWDPERKQWACHWSIAFVHPEFARFHGDDPLAAHLRTIDFVSSLILNSEVDGLIVWWSYEGDHGGLTFPMCEGEAVEGRKSIDEIRPKNDKAVTKE